MKAFSLLYHDVIHHGDYAASGFLGEDANRYKLEKLKFLEQLNALEAALGGRIPGKVTEAQRNNVFLTFDDGGLSAYTVIVPILESLDWPGHFLITVDYLDKPGFVSREHIVNLCRRGHVIGSHSCSHPERMAKCSWTQLLGEWQRSTEILSQLLGEKIIVASVPGGYFSKKVAQAASAAGIRFLFTSEPTNRVYRVEDCYVLGRYTIMRGQGAAEVASLASGNLVAHLRKRLSWNARKVLKTLGGEAYLKIRRLVLNRGQ